jgi:hypothetical protein
MRSPLPPQAEEDFRVKNQTVGQTKTQLFCICRPLSNEGFPLAQIQQVFSVRLEVCLPYDATVYPVVTST